MSFESPTNDRARSSITRAEEMSRTTGRSLEFYKQFLELTPSDFNGKKVLNVGAGRSDINSELEKEGVQPEMLINLDFAYENIGDSKGIFKVVSGKALHKEDIPLTAVAADMKQLPFTDNELDKVICLWSVGWLRDKDKPMAISEAYRVCKDDGEIKIYPISFTKKAQEIAKKYPFIQISKPELNPKNLEDANIREGAFGLLRRFFANEDSGPTEEGQKQAKEFKQLLSNDENILLEFAHRFRYTLEGKTIGALTIKKLPGVDLKTFNNAIQELDRNGVTF